MTILRIAITVVTALLLLLQGAGVSAQDEQPAGAPDLLLLVLPGIKQTRADFQNPLLFQVAMKNSYFDEVLLRNARNARTVEQARSKEEFDERSALDQLTFLKRYAQQPLPGIRLGSKRSPVASLVEFQVATEGDEPQTIKLRSLAWNEDQPGIAVLENGSPVVLYYAMSASQLKKLGAGTYTLRAHIDTREKKNMWRGKAESKAVKVELVGSSGSLAPEEDQQRRYALGMYYLKDKQYDKALRNAEELTTLHPDFVGGWTQKGDALAGLSDERGAYTAFAQANRVYYANQARDKPPIKEPAVYIERRLDELRAVPGAAAPPPRPQP